MTASSVSLKPPHQHAEMIHTANRRQVNQDIHVPCFGCAQSKLHAFACVKIEVAWCKERDAKFS